MIRSTMKRAETREGSDPQPMRLRRCIRQGRQSNRRSMDDLPDGLLLEILDKVCPISIVRCKSVCKSWYALVSSKSFCLDPAFGLIVNIPAPGEPVNEPHYASESSDFRRSRGFKLKYLSCFYPETGRPVCVQASCKDLLLCTESCMSQRKFYIVNPSTMRRIVLPESLVWYSFNMYPIGLAIQECPVDPLGYQFMVVRLIGCFSDFFIAEVFDSDLNYWSRVEVYHPFVLSWKPIMHQGLVYKDALHWLVENGPIVAYDPFAPPDANGRLWCRFIARSVVMRHNGDNNMVIKECITESEGYIRLVQLITFPKLLDRGDEAHNLTVWKLEDHTEGKWVLEDRIYFKDMVSDVSWLQKYVREFVTRHDKYEQAAIEKFRTAEGRFCSFRHFDDPSVLPKGEWVTHKPEPLACHPNKSLVVYIHFPNSVVSCNLLTKKLKLVSRIKKHNQFHNYDTVVPIQVLSQPTPVERCTAPKVSGRDRWLSPMHF